MISDGLSRLALTASSVVTLVLPEPPLGAAIVITFIAAPNWLANKQIADIY